MGAGLVSILLLAGSLPACASAKAGSQPLGNGRHHITCKSPLTVCLRRAEALCPDVSYDVLGARDRRRYTGVYPVESEHRSSEAVIACGSRGAPLAKEQDLVEQVLPRKNEKQAEQKHEESAAQKRKESAAPPPSRLACTPGASQACVGIGGCSGGQACLEDGSGYAPCQCAPEASDPPASSESPSHASPDAGPPQATQPSRPSGTSNDPTKPVTAPK